MPRPAPSPSSDRAAPRRRARLSLPVAAVALAATLVTLAARLALAGAAGGSRAGGFVVAVALSLAAAAALLPLARYVRDAGAVVPLRVRLDAGRGPVRIRWPRRLVGARAAADDGWGRTSWTPDDVGPWSPERDREDPEGREPR